jgi:hypothetical protein
MIARTLVSATLALLLVNPLGRLDAEDAASSPRLGLIGVSGGDGTGVTYRGHCNGTVVLDKNRWVVCFGVKKVAPEEAKYLYIILFKNDPGERVGDEIGGAGSAGGKGFNSRMRITRGGKAIEATYQCQLDRKTRAVTGEELTVGGKAIKEGDPRVLLVDLGEKKIAYRPVKVELPEVVPALGENLPRLDGEEGKTWAKTMLRAVEQLKKKSPEIKKFLEP